MRPITIFGELYSTKNSKRIVRNKSTGKPFIISSAKSKASEMAFILQLNSAKALWSREIAGKTNPLSVQFKIYRKTRGRFDYLNITQGLCDLMVKAGWLEDDNANYLIPVFLPYEVDKNLPRIEIGVL